jgi:hypothetical protein
VELTRLEEPSRLDDPARLDALRRTHLLDSPPDEVFDRFTALVRRTLEVPVSLVTLVDDRRQYFKSAAGLGEPWASRRGTPLTHSFCRLVVIDEAPLVVSDARTDGRVVGNGAITDLQVIAYAGVPLHGPEGHVIGALCAIDHAPRQWRDHDLAVLHDVAGSASDLVALRAAALERRAAVVSVGHRVRSDLTALRLEAQDLETRSLGTSGQGDAGRLSRMVMNLAVLVTDTLADAGIAALGHERRVDLRDVVREVAARAGAARGRTVVVDDSGPVPVVVPVAELAAALAEAVGVLLDQGGEVRASVSQDGVAARVRLHHEGAPLLAAVVRGLVGRADSASPQELPLAERVAQLLGGRLVIGSRASTVDLLLPLR